MTTRTRYPGSRPFTQQDEALFFGREQDILNLATFINVEKLVVLYGKSGLGKSSLLNAGVLPKLEREYAYVIVPLRLNSWIEGSLKYPLDIVEELLARMPYPKTFIDEIETEDVSFWQYIKRLELAHPDRVTVLLVFDQFEELFTYPAGVDSFAESLADLLYGRIPRSFQRALRRAAKGNPDFISPERHQLLERPVNLKVLMSIRSDRMSLLDSLSPHIPSILQNCYELKPLSETQAKSAILNPSNKDGEFRSPPFTYHEQASAKMLSYLTQTRTKPIESFQLQILCEFVEESIVIKRDDRFVESEDLGDLENVYEEYYERNLRKIGDEKAQSQARLFIEEGLIFEREERRISLYEGQIQSEFQINRELLQKLVDTHIIRAEPHGGGGYIYELSHDTLVAPILKAKARRLEEARRRKDEQLRLLRKKQRKKKVVRALLAISFLALPLVGIILLIISGQEDEMPVGIAFAFLFCVPFLLLLTGFVMFAPFAFILEFVSGESVLARLRHRAENPTRKGILTKIGRWLS